MLQVVEFCSHIFSQSIGMSILDDDFFKQPESNIYQYATVQQRLLNFVIDMVVFGGGLVGIEYLLTELEITHVWLNFKSLMGSYLPMVLFYFLFERFTNGKTPGKIFTKTRALSERGDPMNWEQLLLRSAIRIIPFEVFSFLLYEGRTGWHDKWSKTVVVQD